MTRRPERRLAAILAADIVGYSRLVEEDEAATLAAIRDLRTDVIDPLLAGHQGRIVKLMGDGAIVEFASVVDAVACAVALQKAVTEIQAHGPPARRIVFRIGINLGDVVVEGDDLLGDGVNVAARLEQLCEPGGVLVSGTAYDQLQGKLGLPLDFTGEQRVKNIARPVRAYRVRLDGKPARKPRLRIQRRSVAAIVALCLLLAGVAAARIWWVATPAPSRPMVAVVPFAVAPGSDPRLSQLTDNLATGIIDALSISRFWVVMSRGTSFAYRDRPNAAHALGVEQAATFVVNGTLRGSGQQLRASVELVDAATGAQLWSERFDRTAEDPVTLQDELASRIGAAVYEDALQPTIRERAHRRPPAELEAYELADLAREQQQIGTEESRENGLELVQLALARDPRSSAALLTRARIYKLQLSQGLAPASKIIPIWGKTIRTLVEIDPNYAWAQVELGAYYSFSSKDRGMILAALERSVELAPNNPALLAEVAEQLPWMGELRRAAELLEQAARFDPDMRFDWRWFAIDFFRQRFQEAADMIGDFTEVGRWEYLFATLSHAQLNTSSATMRWRAGLLDVWPDYSWELAASETGDFSAAAKAERALWQESHAKADLQFCATAEQIARLKITPLPECAAARKAAAPSAT